MLIECKECHGSISDKALMCPHCGYPIHPKSLRKSRKRLPNGFGSITKINRNLRKPYLVRVTNAKDDFGKPIIRSLGYYKTYNDAYSALIDYNKNPYDLDMQMTVKETYEKFLIDVFCIEEHTKTYERSFERAFELSESLHDIQIRDIRPRHIKRCMENIQGANPKSRFKSFWNRLLDYALSMELVDRNYARDFELDPKSAKEKVTYKQAHLTFSDDEMQALWNNLSKEIVQMVLVQCYMGWRPSELCEIKMENVDLTNYKIKGGSKTESGIDRVVPIHSAVRPLIESKYDEALKAGRKTLYDIKYQQYYYAFKLMVKELNLNPAHRPHDPRKHFVTMALKSGVDTMAVKVLVGHKIQDITEKAYTDRDIEWLRRDIEKIDASRYTNSVQMKHNL